MDQCQCSTCKDPEVRKTNALMLVANMLASSRAGYVSSIFQSTLACGYCGHLGMPCDFQWQPFIANNGSSSNEGFFMICNACWRQLENGMIAPPPEDYCKVVEYCVDPDCHCNDKDGVIILAMATREQAVKEPLHHPGYTKSVVSITGGKRYKCLHCEEWFLAHLLTGVAHPEESGFACPACFKQFGYVYGHIGEEATDETIGYFHPSVQGVTPIENAVQA